jgi:hypothetical protein
MAAEDHRSGTGRKQTGEFARDFELFILREQVEKGSGVDGGDTSVEKIERLEGAEIGVGTLRYFTENRHEVEKLGIQYVARNEGASKFLGRIAIKFAAYSPETYKATEYYSYLSYENFNDMDTCTEV